MRRIAILIGLVVLVAGCPSPSPAPPDYFAPDWLETRHAAHEDPTLRAGGPYVLLCNVDDDDEDGLPDRESAEIDCNRDADDLTRVVFATPSAVAGDRFVLELAAADGGPESTEAAVRVFDEKGVPRLGRGVGAQWNLTQAAVEQLASRGLVLYAEGCLFGASLDLRLLEGEALVDSRHLEVAPLFLAPPTGPVDAVWIGRDDVNGNTTAFYEAFVAAYALADPGGAAQRIRDVPIREYDRDTWIQDEFEWGYTRTPFCLLPVAIHLPRGWPLEAWVRTLLGPDVGYVRPSALPTYGDPQTSLAYGGNVQPGVMPGAAGLGCIYHGLDPGERVLHERLRATLEELQQFVETATRQTVIGIDTSWLYVGHVDELVTFAWSPETPEKIVLLVASPAEGLYHLDQVKTQKVPGAFAENYYDLVTQDLDYDLTWGDFLETRVAAGAPTLRMYNALLEARIFGDVEDGYAGGAIEPLIQALRSAATSQGMGEPTVVRVPAFFYQDIPSADGSSDANVTALALLPNMINLVSVNGHLITPDPLLSGWRGAFENDETIQDGFRVHWIDTFDFLHRKLGGIHCATNTRYTCPEALR